MDGASARPTGTLGSLLCYIKAAAGKISQGGASGRIGFCLGNQKRGLRKEGVSLLIIRFGFAVQPAKILTLLRRHGRLLWLPVPGRYSGDEA